MNNKSAGVLAKTQSISPSLFLPALFIILTIAPGLYMMLSMENARNEKET